MKNKLTDFRNLLFGVIESLQDMPEEFDAQRIKLEIEKAKVIADLSQVMVNSIKVEVEMNIAICAGRDLTGFVTGKDPQDKSIEAPQAKLLNEYLEKKYF